MGHERDELGTLEFKVGALSDAVRGLQGEIRNLVEAVKVLTAKIRKDLE